MTKIKFSLMLTMDINKKGTKLDRNERYEMCG